MVVVFVVGEMKEGRNDNQNYVAAGYENYIYNDRFRIQNDQ